MMRKNPNNGKSLSGLLFMSKLFCVFLLFFIQNFQAQIFISEGVSVYYEKEVLVSQNDSLVSNSPKYKIYISSGAQFSNLDFDNNYEIVETHPSEIKRAAPKKQSVLNLAKAQSEKKIEQKLASKKENQAFNKHVYTNSKSETYFSFAGSFSKVTVPVSQSNVKQIINSKDCKTSLAFEESNLVSAYFKTTEILTAQNKTSYSVRPPPFLS